MRRIKKDGFAAAAFAAALVCQGLIAAEARGGDMGGVRWAETLMVFATLDRDHPVVAGETLSDIPERLEVDGTRALPSLTLDPEGVAWRPGERIDLEPYIGTDVGDTAYVFAEFHSPAKQTVALGIGADWWIECWMNGEPFFDTLESGNPGGRFSILDNSVDVVLREGRNVLAMRFIRGRSSALLAVGDESMFAAERRRQAARYGLNRLPEALSDRLLFPEREQAIVSSGWDVDLSLPDVDLSAGDLAGLEEMPERQLYLDDSGPRLAARDTLNRHFKDEPVKIRLSKYRYPYEDRHLDAIVWTSPPEAGAAPSGVIEVRLKDADGEMLARHEIDELSRSGLFFSVGFPPQLEGSAAALEVVWRDGGREVGSATAPFRVEAASGVEKAGRILLRVINEPGATLSGAPMTTGVPFPRGALNDEANVRLVDEDGAEVALQTKTTARWSRFGPIKWLLCDFTVDLEGGPRTLYLEYGPGVERNRTADIHVAEAGAGFPALDAGRIRVSGAGAIEIDVAGDGNFREVLDAQALHGAFVEHESGKVFTMAQDAQHAVEEIGSEKVVVRRAGWYRHADSGEEFCNYVTRFVFHRGSPVVRIYHTWIFTGDGNSDRIASMGWRFPSHTALRPEGFLTAFEDGEWLGGSGLVQFDYQRYDHLVNGERVERDGRTPGVMSGVVDGTRMTFGAKDFWQNFPSELEVGGDGFAFYNWPKRNPPARFERPVAPMEAFRNRFAHEGNLLDFRMPDEYAEDPTWRTATGGGLTGETDIAEGRPDSVNAQGVARTEEMFLYFADGRVNASEAARVMQGLNDESLRAVPDPAWMTGSGVFSDVPIHPRDTENFAEEERCYDMAVEAPTHWVERLGVYGMWLHGDYPTWSMNLSNRTVTPYRAYRGNHHSWPLRWTPFIRSGEPRFFKIAENATRQMVDANFCHFASEEVDRSVGHGYFRRQGRWSPSLFPWAGTHGTGPHGPRLRSLNVDCDYMWDTYYLTGFGRARDVALLFGELTQHDHVSLSPALPHRTRETQCLLTSYLDMYRATFNPWFLDAVYTMAGIHRNLYGRQDDAEPSFDTRHPALVFGRDGFRGADHAFYKFTGCQEHRRLAMNRALGRGSLFSDSRDLQPRLLAYAWDMTGNEFYRRRMAATLDVLKVKTYDGELDYFRGIAGGHGTYPPLLARDIPKAMAAVAQGESRPAPLYSRAWVGHLSRGLDDEAFHFSFPPAYLKHDGQGPLKLFVDLASPGGRREGPFEYTVHGPEDQLFSGEGEAPQWVEISGGEGVYRVEISGRVAFPDDLDTQDPDAMRQFERHWSWHLSWMHFPMSFPETPEVLGFTASSDGTRVQGEGILANAGYTERQGYWFRVPEDVEAFWIEFRENRVINRVSVWNPNGERVWDRAYSAGERPSRTTIEVPPEQRGELWRATGGGFIVDPKLPPYFSVRPEEWFDPGR